MGRKLIAALFAFQIFAVTAWTGNLFAQEAPEITQADWALKDDPANPGASAIILYRQTENDDINAFVKYFYRIKILKDDGKKYADIEIPFEKGDVQVQDIKGRTLHPDGRPTEFDGSIYDKEVVKARGVSFMAKTFTLPDVQSGCIIEYSYTKRWEKIDEALLHDPDVAFIFSSLSPLSAASWTVQDELFTKQAHFTFRPLHEFAINWTWSNLPNNTRPVYQNGVVSYDATNISGFQAEDYIPPENFLKGRVEFFYVFKRPPKDTKDTKWYWKQMGDERAESVEKFIGKDKSFTKEVNSLVSDSDTPQTKLQKIYARAQQIRNLSFEPQKSEKEQKQEKIRENNSASDVLKHGSGWSNEINDVFVGMARAAGFDAAIVYVVPRNQRFFNPNLLDWSQFSATIADVKVNGKDQFFDPATRFCPNDVLPWSEDTTRGLRMNKQGSSELEVPEAPSSRTVISRKANLQIDEEGGAQGTFELSFTGQDALQRRLDNREKDEAGKRKGLEDEVKQWFASGSTVTIDEMTGWDDENQPLKVKFTVKIEGTAPLGISRLLFPAMPFPGETKYYLQSARRMYPVYIAYSFEQSDDFTLQLPKSMRVESLPAAKNDTTPFGSYTMTIENNGTSVHVQRHFVMREGMVRAQYYSQLRGFLTAVRQADDSQMVFQTKPPAGAGGSR